MATCQKGGKMTNKATVQKRLKHKKRKRLLKYLAIVLILFSFIAIFSSLIYRAYKEKLFSIQNIQIEGNSVYNDETILEYSGLQKGENIFLVNLNDVRYNIEKETHFSKITLTKVMPDTIQILIDEKPMIGVVMADEDYCYFDAKGQLIEKTAYLGNANLPLLTGFDNVEAKDFYQPIIMEPQSKVSEALEVLNQLEQGGVLNEISELELRSDENFQIITKEKVVIIFNNQTDFDKYLNYVISVIQNKKNNLEINLSNGNNPIMKER